MRVLKSDFAKYNVSDDDELLDDLGMSGLCKFSLCSIPFRICNPEPMQQNLKGEDGTLIIQHNILITKL